MRFESLCYSMCECYSIAYTYNVGVFCSAADKFIPYKTANDVAWHMHFLGSVRYLVEYE